MRKLQQDTIPNELTKLSQWVNWRYETNKDGKNTKIPKNPKTLDNASTINSKTWATFEQSLKNVDRTDGIGFVLTSNDPFTGIDLDHCRNSQTGVIELWAKELIAQICSYTEVSPSGEGIRIFVEAKLPQCRKRGNIEAYDKGRYLTVTGNSLNGSGIVKHDGTKLHELLFGKEEHKATIKTAKCLSQNDDILQRMFSAKNGDAVKRLWEGATSAYPSHSEADMSLASSLFFWTGNREETDRLFRQSELYRNKWDTRHYGDGRTYGNGVLDSVCSGDTYRGELSESSHIGGGQLDSSLPEPCSYLQKGSDLRQLNIVIEWIISNLLPKQSITVLYGPGGIGKTWLSLILSQAIAAKDNFMGLAAVTMPIVYIDFENPYPVLIDRVKRIGIDDVLFWHNSNTVLKPPRLDSDNWELYKTLPPGALLIFDTLRASQSKDENDSKHMAFVMQRLKELRDLGFTILLLHHTPKGNDRTYKGSTAIIDLADHALSLHKVRRSNPEGGEIADDDDHDCLYRLGTKNKTRYEPFHIFLSFDPEKGFIKAVDPDEADLLAIHEILTDKGTLNQAQLFEVVKVDLDLKSKGKLVHLLRKGEGKLWHGQKQGRASLYDAIPTVQLSDPYTSNAGQFDNLPQKQTVDLSKTDRTDTVSAPMQTIDRSQLSNCSEVSQTVRTDDVIEVLEVIE